MAGTLLADNWQAADTSKYTGRRLRQMLGVMLTKSSARLLGARSGLPPAATAALVAASTSTWTVHPHSGVLDAEASSVAGAYPYSFDTDQTGSMTPPSSSNQRVDSLFVQVSDPLEGDSTSGPSVDVIYVAGTAGSSGGGRGAAGGPPNFPNTRCMELAQITVPTLGSGSPSVTLVAPYTVAAGGILPIRNATERAALNPYPQMHIARLDTGNLEYWDGAAWQVRNAPDPAYTTLSGFASGALPGPAGNYAPGYKVLATTQRVRMRGFVVAGSTFAAGGVVIIAALPGAIIPAKTVLFPVATQYGSGITVNSDLQIGSDGTMQLFCGPGCTAFSLHGVEYDLV